MTLLSYKNNLVLIFCGIFLWLSTATPVHAGVSYKVEPQDIELQIQPRDIIKREVTLTNDGTQPVTVYPSVNNISLKSGGTIETFLTPVESDRTTSLASWIEISRQGVDLKPGETKKIPVTFRINPEPKAGTYHALIGFGFGGTRDEAERQVQNREAPGTVVTVTYEEKKNEVLKLAGFVIDRFVTKPENEAAKYTFKNPGEETLVPKGEIIIYDNRGKEVGVVTVNEENIEIPPGSEHTFTETLPLNDLFGKYKAFLSIEYGSTQRASVQDTSYFYAFPLKNIIAVMCILGVLVILLSWYVHKKYFDDVDDSDRLSLHIRDSASEPKEHDLDLKKK